MLWEREGKVLTFFSSNTMFLWHTEFNSFWRIYAHWGSESKVILMEVLRDSSRENADSNFTASLSQEKNQNHKEAWQGPEPLSPLMWTASAKSRAKKASIGAPFIFYGPFWFSPPLPFSPFPSPPFFLVYFFPLPSEFLFFVWGFVGDFFPLFFTV